MKTKTKLATLSLVIIILGFSELQAAVKVEAPITRVTAYPRRAMITRSASLELPAGDHTIIIENLPDIADEASFRASILNDFAALLGLNHRVVRHTEAPQKKAAEMDDEIYRLENYIRRGILDRTEVFKQQKSLLLSISVKSGEDMSKQLDKGGLEISQWKEAFDFVGSTLRMVNDSIAFARRELDDVDQVLSKLKADRQAVVGQFSRQSKTVEIDVRLTRAGTVGINLDYVIGGVSWKPFYDARLNDENKNVNLNCFGEVRQTTGEDWNDIDLVLSTSEPAKGTGPGDLIPWILSLYASAPSVADELLLKETGITIDAEGELHIRGGYAGETTYLVDGVNFSDPLGRIINSAFNTTFIVTRKVSIHSDHEATRVPIGNYSLDGNVEFVCRPKNREAAYRLATITNQQEAPLLPGQVAIFAGPDYLGKTFLNRFVAPGDEFVLSFGQDNYIEVEREILENKTSYNGDKIRLDQKIKITLTNNDLKSRTVSVEESLPISEDNRLKVKLRDFQPEKDVQAEKDKSEAVWTVELKSGEDKEITFTYRIEYPTGMQLTGI
jgi:uncharacterized protein (TIGR02231 family)